MLWASRNKHRGRHAAAAATEGGRERGSENIYKTKSEQARKIWNSFFFIVSSELWAAGRAVPVSLLNQKVYFQEEDSCLSQIHSTTVPLTVFTAAPAAPDMTHIEVFKGQFKFYAMEHYMCYAVLHPACVSSSDSCCPLTAGWEMIDYFIAHCMLWYRDSRLKPPNVILVNWNWSKWWQRWMLWVDSYQWNEINHNAQRQWSRPP